MSNRIDFFQEPHTQLAVPASVVSVFVDGRLCPFLELLELVRSGWPEFSWARFVFNPAVYDEDLTDFEDVGSELAMGKSISVQRHFNPALPGSSAGGLSIFEGHIELIDKTFCSDGQRTEIVATDCSARLKRITVYGRRAGNSDGSEMFLSGYDTIFNENGTANATAKVFERNGRGCRFFAAGSAQKLYWSCADAINYLLCEYLPAGCLQTPSVERLGALTNNHRAIDIDVTGLDLIDALQRCCRPAGLKFRFVARNAPAGPRQAIVFYRDGCGRAVELNCQTAGQRFSFSKTNISALKSKTNFWPVTHKYIGQGDFKLYEATFELVKAWDAALEDTDYDRFSPSTNPEFYKVRDVYRKWCLNEAGDYSGEPFNQGGAFDFSKIFQGASFVRRRRRFWPALSADKQNRSLGYFLEVSFDDGANWWQYLYAFDNLLDQCGIWLSSDQLDVDTWVAALKGVLRFRITASVFSDDRLTCVVADGPQRSAAPVVEHLITPPGQFRFRKVSDQSIFAHLKSDSTGTPDEADDTDELYELVRQRALACPDVIGTAQVQTPSLAFDYEPSDRVEAGPDGRDLLGCRGDSTTVRWIERVQMDFQKQCTNLRIVHKSKQQL